MQAYQCMDLLYLGYQCDESANPNAAADEDDKASGAVPVDGVLGLVDTKTGAVTPIYGDDI